MSIENWLFEKQGTIFIKNMNRLEFISWKSVENPADVMTNF